jgi:hypothetical protein
MTPAEKGYALLKERHPDLEQLVKEPVSLASFTRCPLGQVYGSYVKGLRKIWPETGKWYPLSLEYGFDSHCNSDAMNAEWNRLLGQES